MPGEILPHVDRLARAILPAHERSDRRVVARARFGCGVIGILVSIALVRVPMLVSRGPREQALALMLCALLALAVPVIPRVTGSFRHAAHVLVALTLAPLVSVVHFTGGSGSPALLALLITPMIAVFLTGRRGGVAWSLGVGAVICAYALADRFGLSPPILFPPDAWKLQKSIGAFVLTMAVLGLALTYDRAQGLAEAEARNADALVLAKDTDHRASLRWLSHSFAHEANNTLAYVMADLTGVDDVSGARLGAERLRQIVRDVQTITGDLGNEPPEAPVAVDLGDVVQGVLDQLGPLLAGLGTKVRPLVRAEPIIVGAARQSLARCIASAVVAFAPDGALEIRLVGGASPAVVMTSRPGAFEARPLATEALRRTLAALGGSLSRTETDRPTVRLGLTPAVMPAGGVERAPIEAKRLRVLIVDDEVFLLRATARMLRDYEVTTTSSPKEALVHVAKGGVDVVLCDFNIPEMRGDAVLTSAVKAGLARGRFVVMTGGSYEEMESAFGEDPPLVLAKPFSKVDLETILQRAASS